MIAKFRHLGYTKFFMEFIEHLWVTEPQKEEISNVRNRDKNNVNIG
jgi:hypothetical protein